MKSRSIFFGFGTGRSGTMAIANALNNEHNTLALHEGKIRVGEQPGAQHLPFLTLQNRLAYEDNLAALSIVKEYRNPDILKQAMGRHRFFGDIAYNYSPLLSHLLALYPNAKFIFFHRDCESFVRSCSKIYEVDHAPVGWSPEKPNQNKIERFISLGRLQPKQDTLEATLWQKWDYVQKNIWLWSETNSIILNSLPTEKSNSVYHFRYENFSQKPCEYYCQLRAYLGFDTPLPKAVSDTFDRKINSRSTYDTPKIPEWTDAQRSVFEEYAQPIRQQLGYN